MTVWGIHTIANLRRCAPDLIRNPNHIANFTRDLVKRIDMTAYGPPQVVHFGTGNKAGYTLVQLIETSNITGHFAEETDDAYLDIFSCKGYDCRTVEWCLREWFKPDGVHLLTVYRQAGVPMTITHPHGVPLQMVPQPPEMR